MNKFLYSILIAAAGFGTLNAQQKVMKIEYKDGTTEMKNVTDVSKISFVSEGQVDPSEKMVDLGLSVKWASYNVGAANPWEGGNFYAYGEIEPKTEYTLENYQWYCDNDGEDHDQWEEYYKLGATITGTNYDVAHVKWGGQWRIPTRDEWRELINNCDFTWTGMEGVTGALITSRINGNSIFLPAVGNMVGAEHTHDQLGCFYWTSTEYEQADITQECRNYRANIDASNRSAEGYDYPDVGFSIRPVYGPVPEPALPSYTAPTEMVDLGLSVKWAPFNIGAQGASETGDYICWGEITEKQYSHIYNYKWYDPITNDYVEIGDQISGTEYDPANVLWGNGWRLPTEAEIKELIEKCTWHARLQRRSARQCTAGLLHDRQRRCADQLSGSENDQQRRHIALLSRSFQQVQQARGFILLEGRRHTGTPCSPIGIDLMQDYHQSCSKTCGGLHY